MSDTPTLSTRLRGHALLGGVPTSELDWLEAHGTVRRYGTGEPVVRTGEHVHDLIVVLSGRITIRVERAYGRRKVMEWPGGDVTGRLPYSRMVAAPGDAVAELDTDVFVVPGEHIQALTQACPEITAALVHAMLDRARRFTSSDLQDQRTLALGRVAAGLAHELNNPASALVRSVATLREILDESHAAARGLALCELTEQELSDIDRLESLATGDQQSEWGALERADREEALAGRLGGLEAREAAAFAEAPVDLDELQRLAEALPAEKRATALRWLGCHLSACRIAQEMEQGASRIVQLVSAVKGVSHMDRPLDPEALDPRRGIEQALALLREKARAADVEIVATVPADLPAVTGVAGELGQAWHALLDNAIDAAGRGGMVRVTARPAASGVTVEIEDSGPGIPGEVRARMFDPFFTTKPVGRGVGLGLELVRRVVDQHRGEIEVESRPGRTVFRVTLPAATEVGATRTP